MTRREVKVVMPFVYAEDGIHGRLLSAGAIEAIDESLLPGLVRDGYVTELAGAALPSPPPAASPAPASGRAARAGLRRSERPGADMSEPQATD